MVSPPERKNQTFQTTFAALVQSLSPKVVRAKFAEMTLFSGVQRIFVFMDKQKIPTGDCTVTYENSESAARAIEMFNNKDFNGSLITVAPATPEQKQPFANKLVSSIRKVSFDESSSCETQTNRADMAVAMEAVATAAVVAVEEVAADHGEVVAEAASADGKFFELSV